MAGRVRVVLLVLSLVSVPVALSTDYAVGDDSGWTLGVNYADWASGKTFKPGDNLTFNYDGTHSVYQLAGEADYDSCNLNNQVIRSFTSSPNTVTLDKAATTYYFVCGVISHCWIGMKLSVTTTTSASDKSSHPPPSTLSPPSTPAGSTSIPPRASTPPPPPPPSSSPMVGPGVAGVDLLGALVVGLGVLLS